MISNLAVVQTDRIGENVTIGEFSIIRPEVKIGNNVVIHPRVIINSGVVIEDNVEIFPGAYIGKEPKGAGVLARQPQFTKQLVIGENSSIGPNAIIYYDVEIGKQTLIGDGVGIREQCKIGSSCIIGRNVEISYNSIIGNRTRIMDSSHITGNCTIGDDVFISMHVSTANDDTFGQKGYDEKNVVGATVENGAKIGVGAVLLPGITVGEKAIVGAATVVTKNVLPMTLVFGVPGKFIRRVDMDNK
ncbi:transferase [Alkalihalophilus pseudofirmus]|nr:transferase [Alkalihalophilus pseudofirmus]